MKTFVHYDRMNSNISNQKNRNRNISAERFMRHDMKELMKNAKRKLAVILALCLVMQTVIPAYAETEDTTAQTEAVAVVPEAEAPEEVFEAKEVLEVIPEAEVVLPEAVYEEAAMLGIDRATPSSAKREGEILIREITVDGIKITLTADPGVFPEDAELWAERVEDEAAEEAIEEAVEKERDSRVNVASSFKFDIKMLLLGEEIQPDTTKGSVKVTFTLEEKLNDCLTANAYHLKEKADGELKAENLDAEVKTVEAGATESSEEAALLEEDEILSDGIIEDDAALNAEVTEIEAEITGFSYYVVEFTYNELQYVLPGDSSVKLSEILKTLAIEGTVSEAEVSNEELFTVTKDEEGDDWTVTALKPFSSEEWMKVTIDGQVYEIIVTDAAQPAVKYYDYVGGKMEEKTIPNDTVTSYVPVTSDITSFEDGKWYVVNNSVTVGSRIENTGTAHLILMDGCTFTVTGGIDNGSEKSLSIYGQTNNSGTLSISGVVDNCAGIGGGYNNSGGTLTINGGTVNATGGTNGAGIGAGCNCSYVNMSIIINGGTINAVGGDGGSGIGSGDTYFSSGTVTINITGGKITATGGTNGAGIGGGDDSAPCTINITGGKITATGGTNGAGIGGGRWWSPGGEINISRGIITAIGGENAPGIGGGPGSKSQGSLKIDDKLSILVGEDYSEVKSLDEYCKDRDRYIKVTLLASYQVRHYQQKLDLSGYTLVNADTETLYQYVGFETKAAAKTYEGFAAQPFEQKVVSEDGKTVVDIYYNRNICTISFDANGHGTAPESITKPFGASVSEPTAPTAAGYIFEGWYGEQACTNKYTFSTMPSADITLYAKWATPCQVTFTGGYEGSEYSEVITEIYGEKYVLPNVNPERAGYTFAGWYTGSFGLGVQITAESIVGNPADHYIYAKWTELPVAVYTVTWKLDDGALIDTTEVKEGDMPSHSSPSKEGYIFVGWEPTLAPVTSNITYTAKFEQRTPEKAAVTFNTSGGSFIETQVVTRGQKAVRPADPVKTGYSFVNWYADAAFTTAYDFNASVNADITLNAKWQKNAGKEYTITWKDWNGNVLASQKVSEGGLPDYPGTSNPSRSGYIFTGWTPKIGLAYADRTYTATYSPQTVINGGGGGGGTAAPKKPTVTFSPNWFADELGVWRIKDKAGNIVTNTWLCDDVITANGQSVWYLLRHDGAMVAAGLVQDATGNFYSLETNHDGYFGMLRYTDGYYNCNGQQVYLKFSHEHNGTFGAVINAEGIEKLKAIYGVTKFGIGNENAVYTKSFE